MKEVIDGLLRLSDRALDPIAKDMMRKWSDPPTALQVLEVLDTCVNGSLCSDFEIHVLDVIYTNQCKAECTTKEDVEKRAGWRTGG